MAQRGNFDIILCNSALLLFSVHFGGMWRPCFSAPVHSRLKRTSGWAKGGRLGSGSISSAPPPPRSDADHCVALVLQRAALRPLLSRDASLHALTARLSPWGWNRVAFVESAAFMTFPYEIYYFAPKRGFIPPATQGFPPVSSQQGSLLRPCPHAHSSAPRWPQRPALQPEGASHQTAAPGWRGWAGRGWGSAGTGEPELEQELDQPLAAEWSLPKACRG